jgi:hypothetical protein
VLGLADKIAIIERGINGTSVYLIRISYLENNVLDLCNSGFMSSHSSFIHSLQGWLLVTMMILLWQFDYRYYR